MSSETWGERRDRLRGKPLSAREIEIMDLVIMGMDRVKVIADHLGVSDRTVEMHIQAVRVKLRVPSLLQAALAYDRAKAGRCIPASTRSPTGCASISGEGGGDDQR
jgi:DNA-binding NarL/FixJ family response regulator